MVMERTLLALKRLLRRKKAIFRKPQYLSVHAYAYARRCKARQMPCGRDADYLCTREMPYPKLAVTVLLSRSFADLFKD